MGLSDFISFIGLAMAAFALIPWNEKRFYLLFFRKWHLVCFIIIVILIQLQLSFNWLHRKGWPLLHQFTTPYGIPAEIWAYIFLILLIAYPIIKVVKGNFPRKNGDKLVELYKKLIFGNEIPLLISYLESYHIAPIEKLLKQPETYKEKRTSSIEGKIYEHIVTNENFILVAANDFPVFFSRVIGAMGVVDFKSRNFARTYFTRLFENSNFQLLQEIIRLNRESGEGISSNIISFTALLNNGSYPILKGILQPANPAFMNRAGLTFGEIGLEDLQQEKTRKILQESPDTKSFNRDIPDECWNYKIWISIILFDFLLKSAIEEDKDDDHLYIIYYSRFVEQLLTLPPTEKENNSYLLVEFIIDILLQWLHLLQTSHNNIQCNRIEVILVCLGKIITKIAMLPVNEPFDPTDFQKAQLNKIIGYCLELLDKSHAGALITVSFIKLVTHPSDPDRKRQPGIEYRNLLASSWAAYQATETVHPEIAEKFNEIISPLF